MGLKFFDNQNTPEHDIRERCAVAELINDADIPHISVAKCRVKPGIITELHALSGAQEIYLILSGEGDVDDGQSIPRRMKPDDCVVITADHPQRIRNTGAEDLVFIAICTDRFTHERYVPLEDDT